MPAARTQQEKFVDEVLVDLFHTQAAQFLALLQRDGTRFLRFYWDAAGKKFPAEEKIDSFGLNFFVRRPKPFVTVVLITLPKPRLHGEAYYAALVYRPQRTLLLVSDTTSVYSLEAVHPEEGEGQTALVEWTHRRQRLKLQTGIQPALEPFFQAVWKELGE